MLLQHHRPLDTPCLDLHTVRTVVLLYVQWTPNLLLYIRANILYEFYVRTYVQHFETSIVRSTTVLSRASCLIRWV